MSFFATLRSVGVRYGLAPKDRGTTPTTPGVDVDVLHAENGDTEAGDSPSQSSSGSMSRNGGIISGKGRREGRRYTQTPGHRALPVAAVAAAAASAGGGSSVGLAFGASRHLGEARVGDAWGGRGQGRGTASEEVSSPAHYRMGEAKRSGRRLLENGAAVATGGQACGVAAHGFEIPQ